MSCPADSNRRHSWKAANPQIPTQRCGAVGFLRVHAEEDVNCIRVDDPIAVFFHTVAHRRIRNPSIPSGSVYDTETSETLASGLPV